MQKLAVDYCAELANKDDFWKFAEEHDADLDEFQRTCYENLTFQEVAARAYFAHVLLTKGYPLPLIQIN